MKTRKMVMLLAALCLVCSSVILVLATGKAAPQGKAVFADLEITGYASGLTGLFDPSTGKFYLYDANLENCVAIRQLSELGQPMKRIKN